MYYCVTQESKDRTSPQQAAEEALTAGESNKETQKLKFHRNPLKTVTSAARAIRKSPKAQKKSSRGKGRVALMKVYINKT